MFKSKVQIDNEIINYIGEENPQNLPIMLFVHGFGDYSERALSLYRIKNRNYCLYSIDLPCNGKSTCSINKPSIAYYGEILSKFIKKMFQNTSIYIISHSLGAFSSLIAAQNGLVKWLFACTPANYNTNHPELMVANKINWLLPKNSLNLLDSQKNLFSQSELNSLPKNYLENLINNTPQDFYANRKEVFSELLKNELLNNDWLKTEGYNLYKDFKNITLFVASDDNYVPAQQVLEIAQELNLETHYFENSGHAIFYKNSEKINQIVEQKITILEKS